MFAFHMQIRLFGIALKFWKSLYMALNMSACCFTYPQWVSQEYFILAAVKPFSNPLNPFHLPWAYRLHGWMAGCKDLLWKLSTSFYDYNPTYSPLLGEPCDKQQKIKGQSRQDGTEAQKSLELADTPISLPHAMKCSFSKSRETFCNLIRNSNELACFLCKIENITRLWFSLVVTERCGNANFRSKKLRNEEIWIWKLCLFAVKFKSSCDS